MNDFLSQLSAHLKPVNPIEPKGAELVRAIAETPHANPAKYAYEQLEKLIKEFESGLDDIDRKLESLSALRYIRRPPLRGQTSARRAKKRKMGSRPAPTRGYRQSVHPDRERLKKLSNSLSIR